MLRTEGAAVSEEVDNLQSQAGVWGGATRRGGDTAEPHAIPVNGGAGDADHLRPHLHGDEFGRVEQNLHSKFFLVNFYLLLF